MNVFPVRCVDSQCQQNAVCRHNKCTCKIGYIERFGSCEGKIYLHCRYRNLRKNYKICIHPLMITIYHLRGLSMTIAQHIYQFCLQICRNCFTEKCHSFNCPRFSSCVDNKCACNRGYIMINKRCEGMFGHSKIRSPLLNAICNTITYHVYVCYKELWSIYVLVLHIIWKHCLGLASCRVRINMFYHIHVHLTWRYIIVCVFWVF